MGDQLVMVGTLIVIFVLFLQGRIRYDIVALMGLLCLVLTGLIPSESAFSGFSHPAVVTVGAVLIISHGLTRAGVADLFAAVLSKTGQSIGAQLGLLLALVVVASSFMNNVGALALLMPVAVKTARDQGRSPSLFLMPLAFGSLLGGLTTLIGTPPNIIIASFRERELGTAFGMFDFSPVGIVVACIGCVFIALVGWRMIPIRKGQATPEKLYEIEAYTTEFHVPATCQLAGRSIRNFIEETGAEVVIVGLVRDELRKPLPPMDEIIHADDILILEVNPEDLNTLVEKTSLRLVGSKELCRQFIDLDRSIDEPLEHAENPVCEDPVTIKELGLYEAVIMIGSSMVGKTARDLNLRFRYGMNLLAVSRQGSRIHQRLDDTHFQAGDVLLLQGATGSMRDILQMLGCIPLTEREPLLSKRRDIILPVMIFLVAIALTAFKILPIQIAMVGAAVVYVLSGTVSLRGAYESVDWPVIIMLGAMMPVGSALETSGTAALAGNAIVSLAGSGPPWLFVALIILISMVVSNLINNAATAVLMAPVAITIATAMHVSPDPLLMAVAIGSSSPFLTPVGHQSNTLVMGPGGYHFGDYRHLGLPLTAGVLVVAVPLILLVWPL